LRKNIAVSLLENHGEEGFITAREVAKLRRGLTTTIDRFSYVKERILTKTSSMMNIGCITTKMGTDMSISKRGKVHFD